MASRNRDQGENQGAPLQAAPPAGFRRSGTANAAGWFNMKKIGNVLSGTLLGMYTRKDGLRTEGTSNFFQVQIDQPCEVRAERGEEAKLVEAKAGDVVNVNYGPKTKPWENYISPIQHGAVYLVYGTILGDKIKIGSAKSMHNFDVYDKMLSPATSQSDGVAEVFEETSEAEG